MGCLVDKWQGVHVTPAQPACPGRREFDFPKQQAVALKLQRLAGPSEPRYTWWAIVSLLLQARPAASGVVSCPSTVGTKG
jgi:hypothetical protein